MTTRRINQVSFFGNSCLGDEDKRGRAGGESRRRIFGRIDARKTDEEAAAGLSRHHPMRRTHCLRHFHVVDTQRRR